MEVERVVGGLERNSIIGEEEELLLSLLGCLYTLKSSIWLVSHVHCTSYMRTRNNTISFHLAPLGCCWNRPAYLQKCHRTLKF